MTLRDALDLTFDLAFPLVMIAFPAAYAACVRFHEEGSPEESAARRQRAARLTAALWAATAASAALVVGLWAVGLGDYGQFAWMLFFPLWFGLAWPLTAAKNPNWGVRPKPPTRAARLTPRRDPPPAPWPVFATAVLLWLIGTAAAVAGVLRSGRPEAWWLLTMPLGGGFWLAVSGLTYRGWFREAEPLPPHPAPELERAYDAFRLWLRRCFFWFGLVSAAVFTAVGVMCAFAGEGGMPGWAGGAIGGVAGTMLGIAGGVVGTIGTKKRVELNRLYREALRERPAVGAV